MQMTSIPSIGLCLDCTHVKVIPTYEAKKEDSPFYQCLLHKEVPSLSKYPYLPVEACGHYDDMKIDLIV